MLKWTLTCKTVVFVVTISTFQKIWNAEVDEHFVSEREPLNPSDRYVMEVLKDNVVEGL